MTKKELLEQYFVSEDRVQINSPDDIVPHVLKYGTKKKEHFIAVSLDCSHRIIKQHVVTIGIINRTIVHPREVFRPMIIDNAVSCILVHNHPSGNNTPSKEDKDLTERMKQAGDILGISVLDHVIISKTGYYSFLEEGIF